MNKKIKLHHLQWLTKGYILPILAGLAISFALISIFSRDPIPIQEPIEPPPISKWEDNIAGIGVIEPKSDLIFIGTEISGIIRELYVQAGQKVNKNDPLFSLDMRDVDASIKVLQAKLEAAKALYADARSQLDIVRSITDKRAISKDDYNKRKYNYEFAKASMDEAEANLNQMLVKKDRMIVRAPITGTILSEDIKIGEYAVAGEVFEPLIRMGDLSEILVRVEIDEEFANKLNKQGDAEGILRGDVDLKYKLGFVMIEPYVKPKVNLAVAGQRVDTRVVEVLYKILDPDNKIFIGQQMDVFIENINK